MCVSNAQSSVGVALARLSRYFFSIDLVSFLAIRYTVSRTATFRMVFDGPLGNSSRLNIAISQNVFKIPTVVDFSLCPDMC